MKCKVINCKDKVKIAVHQLCGRHYGRFNKYGDPLFTKVVKMKKNCIECGKPTIARDMCRNHYGKWHRNQTGLGK